jgi:ceramide glucosyltransferase
VAKLILARRYAAAHPESAQREASVTIAQPILGGDPFLEEALRRNVESAPPFARFLWLVDEDDALGRQAAAKFAGHERVAILHCPAVRGAENPKSAKLQRALDVVETEFIAVLDDDTILAPEHLPRALAALDTCTLYTGLPCYLRGPNVWSSLVAHFVNNNSITTYLPLLPLIGPLTINGMFYVLRTADLVRAGGFRAIAGKLCDDYALATLIREQGGTIRQGITPLTLHTTVPSPSDYFRIMQRWFLFANVLVRDQPPTVKLILFVFLGMPPLLLWLGFAAIAAGWSGVAILAAVLVARHTLLRALHRDVFGKFVPLSSRAKRSDPDQLTDRFAGARDDSADARDDSGTTLPEFDWWMSIVAELLQPLHWLHATLRNTIVWRTRRIRVALDGTFVYLAGGGS